MEKRVPEQGHKHKRNIFAPVITGVAPNARGSGHPGGYLRLSILFCETSLFNE